MDPTDPVGRKVLGEYLDSVETYLAGARKDLAAGKVLQPPPTLPGPNAIDRATTMYNGMIHPLTPFAVRGAIWYQGESNGSEGESYHHKMKALIRGWRTVFENDDLGFYFVQLADFRDPNPDPAGGDGWAKLREAQRKTLTVPHTGMAVITDIGNARDIHPKNKQDVGARLARWALHQTYDRQDIVPSGPLYKSMAIEGDKIRLGFDHVGGGLMVGERKKGLEPTRPADGAALKHFAIAGADKAWHWADAKIEGDTVVVSSPEVPEPVAVRYAFATNPEGANLYNKEGLPASPFRTDDW
jgi:sialate O-acetylesterase